MRRYAEIDHVIAEYRAAILERDAESLKRLTHFYLREYQRVIRQLDKLDAEYQTFIQRGEKPDARWIFQNNRMSRFREIIGDVLERFAAYADAQTRAEILAAIENGRVEARDIVTRLSGQASIQWHEIDTDAVLTELGMTSQQSPLYALFARANRIGADKAADALVAGILRGQNPRAVAREIRGALGVPLNRALLIARTETIRAHRETLRRSYAENQHLVSAWVWDAALDLRTCPACWAMHGTIHPLSEILNDHPNGRCTMLPYMRDWGTDDLGTTAEAEQIFTRLTDDERREILGRRLYDQWRAGRIQLSEMAEKRYHPVWGWSIRVRNGQR